MSTSTSGGQGASLSSAFLRAGSSSFAEFLAEHDPSLLPAGRTLPAGMTVEAPHGTTIVSLTYDGGVIMASCSCTFRSSIELSADAPLRGPFAAWLQGGVNFNSGRLGAILAAQSMLNAGFLNL